MPKVATCLWFDTEAEEAVRFYTSIFSNAEILSVSRYGDAGPGPSGAVMMVTFRLEGVEFQALNGGPMYAFSPAISLSVSCETQDEVDRLWEKLTEGGEEVQCGWLKDRYGLSWQIVPKVLGELMQDPDPARARSVAEAMLGMTKLDIAGLRRAHEQAGSLAKPGGGAPLT